MYLTPKAIDSVLHDEHCVPVLKALGCTYSPAPRVDSSGAYIWNVYTSDHVLVFTGSVGGIWDWLRCADPRQEFSKLSPMRRDRLVAAFVSLGRDLLGGIRKHASESGADYSDEQHVQSIWDMYARYAGWSYLNCLADPAGVASEALSQWSRQADSDERDDPGAYDG